MLGNWLFERSLKSLRKAGDTALAAYANTGWQTTDTPARVAQYCALDFELDGLGKGAHTLQAGWLPFEGSVLRLDGARSYDIRSTAVLKDEAVAIHGIGEQRALAGRPVGEVVNALLPDLAGRVVVAHGADIEREALQRLVKTVFDVKLPVRMICTLALERYIHPNLVGSDSYRLGNARRRYGLPPATAHDALSDAIATAELFQAQLTRLQPGITLGQLGVS